MEEIIIAIGAPCAISDYILDEEALYIYADSGRTQKTPIDLKPYVDNGLLTVVSLSSEDEEITVVNLAVDLDDGESISGAIALHRGWILATDDKKAIRVLAALGIPFQAISTPDLIKNWVDTQNPSNDEIRLAINNILSCAQYAPPRDHVLYGWWNTFA